MGRGWKLAIVAAAAIGFVCIFVYATGAAMLVFRPYASSTVKIEPERLDRWKQMVRLMAAERTGFFREKSLDRHWGGGDSNNFYTWRQFGFCGFSECLVFSNHFGHSEFNVLIYENRLFGDGSSLQSYLEAKGVRLHWVASPPGG